MATSTTAARAVYARGYTLNSHKTAGNLIHLEEISKLKLVSICSGEDYSLGLTVDGKVKLWKDQDEIITLKLPEPICEIDGNNDSFFMLAESRNGYVYNVETQEITLIEDKKIESFAMLAFNIFYLDFHHRLYLYPDILVEIELNEEMDKVMKLYGTNQARTIFLRTLLGKVYTNDRSLRGTAVHQKLSVWDPEFFEVKYFSENLVQELYPGIYFTVAHLRNGSWVIFGDCEHPRAPLVQLHPATKIEMPFDTANLVSCHVNWYSGIFVTKSGELYGFGANEFAELVPKQEWEQITTQAATTMSVSTTDYKPPIRCIAYDISAYNQIPLDPLERLEIIGNGGQFYFLVKKASQKASPESGRSFR